MYDHRVSKDRLAIPVSCLEEFPAYQAAYAVSVHGRCTGKHGGKSTFCCITLVCLMLSHGLRSMRVMNMMGVVVSSYTGLSRLTSVALCACPGEVGITELSSVVP